MRYDQKVRLYGTLVIGGFLLMFAGLIVIDILDGDIVWTFYPGLLVGVLFGIAMDLSLEDNWDPKLLAPKHSASNSSQGCLPLTVAPALGVLVGNIVAQFFGVAIRSLALGMLAGWLYTFLGYMAIQVWRHRPK